MSEIIFPLEVFSLFLVSTDTVYCIDVYNISFTSLWGSFFKLYLLVCTISKDLQANKMKIYRIDKINTHGQYSPGNLMCQSFE